MYAYHKRLDYFSTECVYAPFATRGLARDFIKELEVGAPCCLLPGWADALPHARAGLQMLGSLGVLKAMGCMLLIARGLHAGLRMASGISCTSLSMKS